jgi:hypothetical protein
LAICISPQSGYDTRVFTGTKPLVLFPQEAQRHHEVLVKMQHRGRGTPIKALLKNQLDPEVVAVAVLVNFSGYVSLF